MLRDLRGARKLMRALRLHSRPGRHRPSPRAWSAGQGPVARPR
ncbi:hypothetical protein ACFPRL_07295 [Pseudoclavibacter helvolus]